MNKIKEVIRYGVTTEFSERAIGPALNVLPQRSDQVPGVVPPQRPDLGAGAGVARRRAADRVGGHRRPRTNPRYERLAERFPMMVKELRRRGGGEASALYQSARRLELRAGVVAERLADHAVDRVQVEAAVVVHVSELSRRIPVGGVDPDAGGVPHLQGVGVYVGLSGPCGVVRASVGSTGPEGASTSGPQRYVWLHVAANSSKRRCRCHLRRTPSCRRWSSVVRPDAVVGNGNDVSMFVGDGRYPDTLLSSARRIHRFRLMPLSVAAHAARCAILAQAYAEFAREGLRPLHAQRPRALVVGKGEVDARRVAGQVAAADPDCAPVGGRVGGEREPRAYRRTRWPSKAAGLIAQVSKSELARRPNLHRGLSDFTPAKESGREYRRGAPGTPAVSLPGSPFSGFAPSRMLAATRLR